MSLLGPLLHLVASWTTLYGPRSRCLQWFMWGLCWRVRMREFHRVHRDMKHIIKNDKCPYLHIAKLFLKLLPAQYPIWEVVRYMSL
ncbi:hypothetical protein BDZ91DRAFT_727976 [Kalaharituber pfeilii]|nr:hypothetical protein BDZ91DRAFT_727976 [Kalaharituber pfeilii]